MFCKKWMLQGPGFWSGGAGMATGGWLMGESGPGEQLRTKEGGQGGSEASSGGQKTHLDHSQPFVS